MEDIRRRNSSFFSKPICFGYLPSIDVFPRGVNGGTDERRSSTTDKSTNASFEILFVFMFLTGRHTHTHTHETVCLTWRQDELLLFPEKLNNNIPRMKQHDVFGSPGTNQDWNKQHYVPQPPESILTPGFSFQHWPLGAVSQPMRRVELLLHTRARARVISLRPTNREGKFFFKKREKSFPPRWFHLSTKFFYIFSN